MYVVLAAEIDFKATWLSEQIMIDLAVLLRNSEAQVKI